MLADVVEALIGAAYLHGSFDLALECAKLFNLGMEWRPLNSRFDEILQRVDAAPVSLPSHLGDVERMLGYTFKNPLLLLEALTHATYQEFQLTVSYERLEFLGDSVLDMVVTEYLYNAPGKDYSPGHMFLRKSALVNAHLLAYICLSTSADVEAAMPRPVLSNSASDGYPDGRGNSRNQAEIRLETSTEKIYLYQCLLHSNHRVLDDQHRAFRRYTKSQPALATELASSPLYPWAALLCLQAPKFLSDMIESLLGAVYLDSRGDMDAIRAILAKLGLMRILERIVEDDVDVLHPVSRLSLWAQKGGHELKYEYKLNDARTRVACVILVDGIEEVRAEGRCEGRASNQEMRFVAAEEAIRKFCLRDGRVVYGEGKRRDQTAKGKGKEEP